MEGAAPSTSVTTIATSGTPIYFGQPVTFTASVSSTSGTIPNGEAVTFYDGHPKDAVIIGSGTTSGGVATFTPSSMAVGTHYITAVYEGDANFRSSHGSLNQVVQRYTTTTTITSSANPACQHTYVTFTATVTSDGGPTPTGKVYFTGIGYGTLSGGQASVTKYVQSAYTHFGVTPEYQGDAYNAPSRHPALVEYVKYCE